MYAMNLREGNDLERGVRYAMMGMSLDPLWQLLFIADARTEFNLMFHVSWRFYGSIVLEPCLISFSDYARASSIARSGALIAVSKRRTCVLDKRKLYSFKQNLHPSSKEQDPD